jgi:hypothetical protein
VIAHHSTWSYFKGTQELPTDWANVDFVMDNSWLEGDVGIGYGDGDDATLLLNMRYNYNSVYTRKTFNLVNLESITHLQLEIDYDDGFVAYLNGQEVARSSNMGAPGTLGPIDATLSEEIEAGTIKVIVLSQSINLLQSGLNVLAIHGHNHNFSSSDFSLHLALSIGENDVGIPAFADGYYFKSESIPPLDNAGLYWNEVDYNEIDSALWYSGIAGWGYGDGDDSTLLSDMRYNYVSVYERQSFFLSNATDVTELQLVIDYDDAFVAYLNGIDVARSNNIGTPGSFVPLDATASS